MMTAAASVSPEALADAFAMFPNARITETYGWTEAGFATDEIKRPETLADATVGYSTLGCEIAILDPGGNPVPPGEQGEVAVKTVAHFSGYLNRPDATAAAWAGDFLRSDDIGVLEKDGRLRIIDRKNGLIISGGENVYAAEVERVLISHPQIRDVTVVGKPDPRWGEVVVAVVVPEPGAAPDPAEVTAYCRARLAGYNARARSGSGTTCPATPWARSSASSSATASPPGPASARQPARCGRPPASLRDRAGGSVQAAGQAGGEFAGGVPVLPVSSRPTFTASNGAEHNGRHQGA